MDACYSTFTQADSICKERRKATQSMVSLVRVDGWPCFHQHLSAAVLGHFLLDVHQRSEGFIKRQERLRQN